MEPLHPPKEEEIVVAGMQKERNITDPLYNMEYEPDYRWVDQPTRRSSSTPVELSLYLQAYRDLKRPCPTSRIVGRQVNSKVRRVVADTGVQVNIVDAEVVRAMQNHCNRPAR